MTAPIPTREDERARRHIEGWWFVACELVTVAALLASLVSIVQSSDRPARHLRGLCSLPGERRDASGRRQASEYRRLGSGPRSRTATWYSSSPDVGDLTAWPCLLIAPPSRRRLPGWVLAPLALSG